MVEAGAALMGAKTLCIPIDQVCSFVSPLSENNPLAVRTSTIRERLKEVIFIGKIYQSEQLERIPYYVFFACLTTSISPAIPQKKNSKVVSTFTMSFSSQRSLWEPSVCIPSVERSQSCGRCSAEVTRHTVALIQGYGSPIIQ